MIAVASPVLATSKPHWAASYLGKRWVAGGRGPDVFDCWGLCYWLQKEHYGRELPLHPIHPSQRIEVARAFNHAVHSDEWVKLSRPIDGCMVSLSRGLNGVVTHVGMYLDIDGGVIIHANDPTVYLQTASELKAAGWIDIGYYHHTSWQQ